MKQKHQQAAANKRAMREGYQAVEDALQSLADQAQELHMGWQERAAVLYDDGGTIEFIDGIPTPEPERLWTGSGDTGRTA